MMEKEDENVTQHFDKTTQLWAMLEEDDRFQQLDQQEEEMSIVI
jgi:hypothetical protein